MITVVFIKHDMDIVFKIAPEIVVLRYGRILGSGMPDAIRRSEAVIDAYLGTEHHGGAASHCARRLGFVPEDRQIFPERTVEDNLVIGARRGLTGRTNGRSGAL